MAGLRIGLVHLLLLLAFHAGLGLAQVSVVGGVTQFAGTPVSTNPAGVPTLVYNCAKTPALCENVHQRNPLSGANGRRTTLQGPSHIVLHFDTDGGRRSNRNSAACPGTWKNRHPCPEGNQPPTVPQGASLGSGSFAPLRYNPNNVALGQAGFNTIARIAANGQPVDAGMMWTCDEFPPACSVEGGANAQTYCVPMSHGCAKPFGNPNPAETLSEQNFQSSAQQVLRHRVWSSANPTGIFVFHFKTVFVDDANYHATYVEWSDSAGSEFLDPYQKRSESSATNLRRVFREGLHSNGSVLRTVHFVNDTAEPDVLMPRQEDGASRPNIPAAQQSFELLPEPPLLPVIEVQRDFIASQELESLNDTMLYIARVLDVTSNGTSAVGSNITVNALHSNGKASRAPTLISRATGRQCDPVTPCPDGSCCTKQGKCGFGKENCDKSVCVSNCNATAFCGRDSLGGAVKCPLNVCCSPFGFCGVGDDFCIGTSATNVCQQGFGTCGTVSPPTCGGRSAYARTLGYYQLSNVRDRQCNRITPAQIDTTGLTHLYAAFATIDPNTLTIAPANAADVDLYKQFTALKKSTLQTWIAVGGWDFNDPGPTRTTFSDLSASASRRARFINSVMAFMDQHGFQGVDLDWEYPGAPDRGGKPEDVDNFVTLVKEMRAAFGSRYGISLTLPASYWYLRWFKPKEMEPYVDFFGLMTYDLHGPWDADVSQIGKVVLGQTNIPEVYNWTQPLWYAGLDPAKINFGLAYYGRGYTLADPSCNSVGCAWSGASRAAPCTNFGGVMSLQELQRLPAQVGAQPQLLAADMMKQLTWGNQWIGYDDEDTIRMKKNWASQHCYGGTMIWSVDLYSGAGSGDSPDGGGSTDPGNPGGGQGGAGSNIVYIDPSIWKDNSPTLNCRPPCSFVLPPLQLSTKTTIRLPPYVTSLDVAWSGAGGWTSTIQTTTLTVPPITTDRIEVWGHSISDTRSSKDIWETFYVTPSIRPSPFVITNDPNPESSPGVSHPPVTRTITPPPYPYTYTPTDGAKPSSSSSTDIIPILPFFPIPTYRPGKPGPLCKTGCGSPCLIFCDHPCLLDCSDGGGNDFGDPKNPVKPPKPKPSPPDTPRPTAKPNPDPLPVGTDPDMVAPTSPEEEEIDRGCALEYGLPVPKYDGPIGKPSSSASTSVATPPPAPSPSPPPKPDPPGPNRNTESLHCYNSGRKASRRYMIESVTSFCNAYGGYTLDASASNSDKTLDLGGGNGDCGKQKCTLFIEMSITVRNGCRFQVEGPGNNQRCGRIFRRIIDECDTESTEGKQGGTLEDNCSIWRMDPLES